MEFDNEFKELYRELILEESRDPKGKVGKLSSDKKSNITLAQNQHQECPVTHQLNPSCGDEVYLAINFKANGEKKSPKDYKKNPRLDKEITKIQEITWVGDGSSISQASLSLLVRLLEGKSVAHALDLLDEYKILLTGTNFKEKNPDGTEAYPDFSNLGDLEVMQNVKNFPNRVKCALLGATAIYQSINQNLNLS